ncbi:ABC transporter, ATP-binding subunit, PQQ-dependent alcohol dehydrogenase system [compost metagenome]
MLWTTHLLDEVQASDELLILNRGRLVAQGLASQIGADDASLAATFERLTSSEVAA